MVIFTLPAEKRNDKDTRRLKKYIYLKIKNVMQEENKTKKELKAEAGFAKSVVETKNVENSLTYAGLCDFLLNSTSSTFFPLVEEFEKKIAQGEHTKLKIDDLARLIKQQIMIVKAVTPTIRKTETRNNEDGSQTKIWKEFNS